MHRALPGRAPEPLRRRDGGDGVWGCGWGGVDTAGVRGARDGSYRGVGFLWVTRVLDGLVERS